PRRIDGPWIELADGRRLANFGANDYLGLASEHASSAAAAGSGASPGSGASALVCGWTEAHQRLANTLASFESTEAAVLFPSGFAACSGTVATLAQRGDLILSDQLNHASLIDGCRLSAAHRLVYPHRDCDQVERMLRQSRGEYQRVWIVTDGVFSMDGHVAPLRRLCDLADRYDAQLIVDEAHGTGVLGAGGTGVCEALGVKDRVPIRIGTLSKAIGTHGGFVAAPRVVIDYLINRCRPLIYSTALPPASILATEASLEQIRSQPQRRDDLHDLARHLRDGIGIEAEPPEQLVPIVPVIVGGDQRASEMSSALWEAGFYVPAIRPPTVPEGSARLRISLSALHQRGTVDELLGHLKRLGLPDVRR
ncbi:MAG: 8-amino-7-oxononanoate synthase, partial [Planctomycetes bacterium]|nr:8-amino-7-oxononanoate synthase [Planctomycetota bacterium]